MATNNTYINAQDDFTVKGNLTVEGNVTQVTTTINENRVAAEEFIINSDGTNTTAKLTLNSNNTLANISFVTGGNMVVEPNLQGNIIIGAGQTLTVDSGASISGNVFTGNLQGEAANAITLSDFVTVVLDGDATGQAQFRGAGNTATIPLVLDSVNANTGSFGNAATIPNFTVNAKGLITAAGETAANITASQVSDFTTSARAVNSGSLGVEYNASTGVISLSQYSNAGQFGNATAVPQIDVDSGGRLSSVTAFDIAIPSTQVTDFETAGRALISDNSSSATGDGSLTYSSATGVITYTGPSAAEVRAHFTGGTGITYDNSSGAISIDSTVVTKADAQTINGDKTFTGTVDLTGATIPGTVTFAGNIIATNIDTVTQTDSIVTDNNIFLNKGGVDQDAKIQVEHTTANVYLKWDEGTDRWQFSNDGSSDNNMLLLSDFSGGTGITYSGGAFSITNTAVSAGTYGTSNDVAQITINAQGQITGASDVAIDHDALANFVANEHIDHSGVTLTAGDGLSGGGDITANRTFALDLNELTSANVDVSADSIAIIDANDSNASRKESIADFVSAMAGAGLSATNGVLSQSGFTGTIETADVGATGQDILQGSETLGNGTIRYYIRSIDGGTYTTSSESGNVITIDGNISAIRTGFSGSSGVNYDPSTGAITADQSEIRGLFSPSGSTLSYDSGTGIFTSTADNYSSWSFDTSSGSAETVTSGETVIFNAGTGIDISHSNNTITIAQDSPVGDITSVVAGSGLIGGGTSDDVTLNAVGGYGITVNADDIEVANADIRGLISATGDISYDSSTGVISFTNDAGDIESVTAGTNLTGGGTSGAVTLDLDTGNDIDMLGNKVLFGNMYSTEGDLPSASTYHGMFAHVHGTGKGYFAHGGNWIKLIDETSSSTTNLSEGTNLYYTDARARASISVSGDLSYNSSTGVISFTNDAGDIESVVAGAGLTGGATSGVATLDIGAGTGITVNADDIAVNMSAFDTGDLSEGSNLYFTNARADARITAALIDEDNMSSNSATRLPSQQSVKAYVDSQVASKDALSELSGDTDDVSEGSTNLYHTTARARAAISVTDNGGDGSLTYNSGTGVITYTGPSASEVRAHISAIDNGGDGSLTYNSGTGVITYTGPSASEVNSRIASYLSGGSGISLSSGVISVNSLDTTKFTSTNTASRVVVRDSDGSFAANIVTATATKAQYADLAENYVADADYEPGTVLILGGEHEVTVTDEAGSYKAVGVVSTDPAHLMNSTCEGEHVVAVALRGRVPCKVIGNINKGDVLVASDTPGYAMVGSMPHTLSPLQIVGRSLEAKTDAQPGVIEILV